MSFPTGGFFIIEEVTEAPHNIEYGGFRRLILSGYVDFGTIKMGDIICIPLASGMHYHQRVHSIQLLRNQLTEVNTSEGKVSLILKAPEIKPTDIKLDLAYVMPLAY
ncbi:hypothetical protein [Microscilla marina]|uniref:Uncharacterized protein n=1 Tax=Microscilla marina ATCC 23134 TaxID=313606 RepID=A1ZP11_MICM2|nr:hypothetical protein [Microscilla marina]EAY27803.1 hypothetical protein M23134_00244 [Microscilla marina ATCC 23134]